jgi:hypothetical protein
LAAAVLLLEAMARLKPGMELAELLPNCTSCTPLAEIDRPPLVVCCVVLAPVDVVLAPVDVVLAPVDVELAPVDVELAPVDVGLVSAHAVAVPTPSARRGAPAHIVTAPNTVFFFIGVSFTLTPRMAFVGRGRDSARINHPHGLSMSRIQ